MIDEAPDGAIDDLIIIMGNSYRDKIASTMLDIMGAELGLSPSQRSGKNKIPNNQASKLFTHLSDQAH